MNKIILCFFFTSFAFIFTAQQKNSSKGFQYVLNEKMRSSFVLNDSMKHTNNPHNHSAFKISLQKLKWKLFSFFGPRLISKISFPKSTISFIKTKQKIVAFSIDDGFCRTNNKDGCMIDEIRKLFEKYDAKATFFTTGSHCEFVERDKVDLLLSQGHELANHNMFDQPYNKYSSEEFQLDLKKTDSILTTFSSCIPKLYRSPFGKFSKKMNQVLKLNNYIHVTCDVFANDVAIDDPQWISSHILKTVKPGSIILIHMPEIGFREWNFEAIKRTLEGLKGLNYDVVTVSALLKVNN